MRVGCDLKWDEYYLFAHDFEVQEDKTWNTLNGKDILKLKEVLNLNGVNERELSKEINKL